MNSEYGGNPLITFSNTQKTQRGVDHLDTSPRNEKKGEKKEKKISDGCHNC